MKAKHPGSALPLCSELTAEQRKFMPCRDEMPAENTRPLVSGAHTPGPWEVRPCLLTKNLDICLPVESGKTAVISTAWGNEANARLIAAAPDLLNALEEALGLRLVGTSNPNIHDDQILPVEVTMGELRRARAAIAKARGEA